MKHESIGNLEGECIGYLKDARRRDDALLVSGTQNKVLVSSSGADIPTRCHPRF